MQWQDEAIIVSVRPFSEKEAVVEVFSRAHGIYRAVARNALTSKQRGIFQPGNLVFCRWNARLAEQMGTVSCELLQPNAALAMQSPMTLSALNAMTSLLGLTLHERDAHPVLYDRVNLTVQAIAEGRNWQLAYLLFERDLLKECGFGLDLSECAATGATSGLMYVSPKSGRAVSSDAGELYKEKLFRLPGCLLTRGREGVGVSAHSECEERPTPILAFSLKGEGIGCGDAEIPEILDGLRITGYFIQERLLSPQEAKMPEARGRLMELLASKETVIPAKAGI